MFLPFRILKAKPSSPDRCDSSFSLTHFVFSLLEPAAEPFLMIRAQLDGSAYAMVGLQFVDPETQELHFTNIVMSEIPYGDGPVEVFLVIELELARSRPWNIAIVMPDGNHSYPYCLRCGELGYWELQPLEQLPHVSDAQTGSFPELSLIGGPAKSGTTWVQRILNSHPDALATGEQHFFGWPGEEQLVDLFKRHPPADFSMAVSHMAPFRSDIVRFWGGRCQSVLGQIGRSAGVQVVLDKTPRNSTSIRDILAVMPDVPFIHCIRHPLDVFVSRFFHERNLLENNPDYFGIDTASEEMVAHILTCDPGARPGEMFDFPGLIDWMVDDFVAANLPLTLRHRLTRFHAVTYESLHSDFENAAKALFEFLGLSTSRALLAEIHEANSFGAYTGRKNGQEVASDFYRKGVVGDHRNYMTEKQIGAAWAMIEVRLPGVRELWPNE